MKFQKIICNLIEKLVSTFKIIDHLGIDCNLNFIYVTLDSELSVGAVEAVIDHRKIYWFKLNCAYRH